MENIRIKASGQVLLEGSQDVANTLSQLRSHFSNIEAAVKRSSGYWQGDAAEAHRTAYQEMKGTIDEIMAKLLEHTEDLTLIAQNYTGAEKEAVSRSVDLPSDVIL